jgi:uncharacterized protein
MPLDLSPVEARRFLARYHFAPTDVPGVLARHATVQYDPLNPVGRNPDLVFQARVPGYQVDDWQAVAYDARQMYDSWDKQACLVPIADWPRRALIRTKYQPYHDREILEADPAGAAALLATLDARGPLSSLEFDDQSRHPQGEGSWYGATRTKRLLRALWAAGEVVIHHRQGSRHYYDRACRVIPAPLFEAAPLLDEDAYHRWLMLRRHQATGLLRPTAEPAIWSGCGDKEQRVRAVAELVEEGALILVRVGGGRTIYHMLAGAAPLLEAPPLPRRVIFLGPLDSLVWDRQTVRVLFGFDYTWEVYKPEPQRKWGYYVLPVFYGDRFVARIDSRLDRGVWTIARWWWEPDVTPDADLLGALTGAARAFLAYLRAVDLGVSDAVEPGARAALIQASA